MQEMLKSLRENQPREFAGKKVESQIDYLTQEQCDLPKSNVLQYDLEGGAQVIVRPSGTEPQIKVYLTVAQTPEENEKDLALLERQMQEMFRG